MSPLSTNGLRPLKGHAILKPYYGERVSNRSGLIVPVWEPYPQAGTCVASAVRGIQPGDLVVIPVESADVAHTYDHILAITLLDVGWIEPQEVLVSMDSEPLFRETMQKYERNGEERKITLQDLEGEGWSFWTCDVLTWDVRSTSSPAFSLLYPSNVKMFEHEGETYYLIKGEDALCLIR